MRFSILFLSSHSRVTKIIEVIQKKITHQHYKKMKKDSPITIIIPHASKNNKLLIRNLPYINLNIHAEYIYIITAKENIENISKYTTEKMRIIDENTVYDSLNFNTIREYIKQVGIPENRTGWYFQQFLKMAWAYTPIGDEWYLVWDSDTFPLKPLFFFDELRKPLFSKKINPKKDEMYHAAYFESLKILLQLEKQTDFSFISEYMIFNKKLMIEMLEKITAHTNKNIFACILDAAQKTQTPYTGFSEFETYGNYIIKNHPDTYSIKDRKSFRFGARYFGVKPSKFDLLRLSESYETASFEHWDYIFPPFILLQKFFSVCLYPIYTLKKNILSKTQS